MLLGWSTSRSSHLVATRHRQQCRRSSSSLPAAANHLRELMRTVAQPVAVITANIHGSNGIDAPDHGATVSSFVSIALSPSPLVAFALRLPSRLASHLNHASSSAGRRSDLPKPEAMFRIHLLSQEQENLARAFARQPPLPSKATPSSAASLSDTFAPFPKELFQQLEEASLGSLDCTVTGRVHLTEPLPSAVGVQTESYADAKDQDSSVDASQATSQLFIAKVLEARTGGEGKRKPLLYCGQNYRSLA